MTTTPLAMLTLLSPAWLLGLGAAVGLPVAAHLLSKARYRPVDFPATRFVVQAVAQAAQVNRPRHILLMLLRVMALALVVLAFAGPRWHAAVAGQDPAKGQAVVIVLDASASMQRTERGASLFDQAKARAGEALDALDPATDTATILLVGETVRPLLPEPSANLTLLRERLDATRCTFASADLGAAVALADSIASRQDRAGRIVVISDGQASNRPASGLRSEVPGVVLVERRVGDPASENLSVHLLDASPYPPIAGRPITLRAVVRNHGQAERTLTLRGACGSATFAVSLRLPPMGSATQSVTLTPEGAGFHTFRVWIEADDAFHHDNTTGLAVEMVAARHVLLVTDADVSPSAPTAAARIALALDPAGDHAAGVRVEAVTAVQAEAQVRAGEVSAGSCWVLTGIDRVPEQFAAALREHLEAGGGVVWIADTLASRDAMGDFQDIPIRLRSDAPGSPSAPGDTTIAVARFDHPALSVFEGPSRASLVGARITGAADGVATGTAEALLSAADGRPVLAATRIGRAHLVVLNADLSPTRSDFASLPAFVPLINELVAYAAPGPAMPPPLRPGDRLPDALTPRVSLQSPQPALDDPGRVTAPGLYAALDAAGDPVAGRWAELDPAESDFSRAEEGAQASPMPSRPGAPAAAAGLLPLRAVLLWPYCIVGALLLLGAESLALRYFAQREARA